MKRPNVILISIDTLRADHLSCFGYGRATTPNIDKLAAEGTIFKRNYSTGVWTPPGHASMLTGLYVSEHGVYDTRKLAEEIPTIATTLKKHGYQTAGFVNNSQVGALVGLDKGHDEFVEVWKGLDTNSMTERIAKGLARRFREKLGYEDMGAARTNSEFRSWIERHIEPDEPFYTFLHYIEPHNPLNPPRPFNINYPANIDAEKVRKVAHNPLICFIEDLSLTREEVDFLISLYDAEIQYTDTKIKEVVDVLKANGHYDDTMIIITSDHGEHFGEYRLWSHVASLYREVLNVPLVIKFPKGYETAGEVTGYTQLVDIFPTVMDVTAVSAIDPVKTSGVSLVHRSDRENIYHNYAYAEWEGRIPYYIQNNSLGEDGKDNAVPLDSLRVQMSMIQNATHKYIWKSDGGEEFFEVSNGLDNPCDPSTAPAVAEELRAELARRRKDFSGEGASPDQDVDEEIEKNLKALGYL